MMAFRMMYLNTHRFFFMTDDTAAFRQLRIGLMGHYREQKVRESKKMGDI